MKKILSLAAFFAFAAISFSGCTTVTNVPENTQQPNADWNSTAGTLSVYYPHSSMEEVFIATKKGLDDMKYFRTGEDLNKKSIRVYSRTVGDINVTVDIDVVVNQKTKEQKTRAIIGYGSWGNLAESQKIAGAISKYLNK